MRLLLAAAALLVAAVAGCSDAPGADADPDLPADAAAPASFEESTWSATYSLVVSRQVDGGDTTTDLLHDGDPSFAIPAGSQQAIVNVVIDGPAWPLAWELGLHGNCRSEPVGETHVQGQSPLRLEFNATALASADCGEMYVFVQAADDARLPASATFAAKATWTAAVLHPAL